MLVAVAIEAAAGFLPWVRTGQRERTSFELISSARSLGVLDSGLERTLALAWYLVPLAATLAWLATLLHRERIGAALAVAAGVLGVGMVWAIDHGPIATLVGVRATLCAALVATAGGTLVLAGRETQ